MHGVPVPMIPWQTQHRPRGISNYTKTYRVVMVCKSRCPVPWPMNDMHRGWTSGSLNTIASSASVSTRSQLTSSWLGQAVVLGDMGDITMHMCRLFLYLCLCMVIHVNLQQSSPFAIQRLRFDDDGGGGSKGNPPEPELLLLVSELPRRLVLLDELGLLRPGIEMEKVWPSFRV